MRGFRKYKKALAAILTGAMVFVQPFGNMIAVAEDDVVIEAAVEESEGVNAESAVEESSEETEEEIAEATVEEASEKSEEVDDEIVETDVIADEVVGGPTAVLEDISPSNFVILEGDDEEIPTCVITSSVIFDNLTIPEGYRLQIEGGQVTVKNLLKMGDGSRLCIYYQGINAESPICGSLEAGSFDYVGGVSIQLQNNKCIPEIAGYPINLFVFSDGKYNDVSADSTWAFNVFDYTEIGSGSSKEKIWLDTYHSNWKITEDVTYDNLTIPAGRQLNIEGCTVTVTGTLKMEEDSFLELRKAGNTPGVIKAGSLDYEGNVGFYADNCSCIPVIAGNKLTVKDFLEEGLTDITNDPNWTEFVFNNVRLDENDQADTWLRNDFTMHLFYGDYEENKDCFQFTDLNVTPDQNLSIEGAKVEITNLTIEDGGELSITNADGHFGQLIASNVSISNGARLFLQSKENLPSGWILYGVDRETNEIFQFGDNDYAGICYFSFDYTDGKWVARLSDESGDDDNGGNVDEPLNLIRLQQEMASAKLAFGDIYTPSTLGADEDGYDTYGQEGSDGFSTFADLKYGIARYLYEWNLIYYNIGGGGRYQREGEALGLKAIPTDKSDPDYDRIFNENVEVIFKSIFTSSGESQIGYENSDIKNNVFEYTVNVRGILTLTSQNNDEYKQRMEALGIDPNGSDFLITGKVVLLDMKDSQQYFIVSVGEHNYLYNSGYVENSSTLTVPTSIPNVEGTYAVNIFDSQLAYDSDGNSNVDVYGNFTSMQVDEVLSDSSARNSYIVTYHGGMNDNDGYYIGGKLAVYSNTFVGVGINAKDYISEEGAYDYSQYYLPAYMGANSYYPIYEMQRCGVSYIEDVNTSFDVFYGCREIELRPLCVEGTEQDGYYMAHMTDGVNEIVSARIDDSIPASAARITKSDATAAYVLNIYTDYYENIKVYFTDKSGAIYAVNVHRTGVIVQNGRTAGDNTQSMPIFHGHDNGNSITPANTAAWSSEEGWGYVVYATFYYSAEDTTTSSTVDLYVTATFKDGHQETQIVSSTYFTPAENIAKGEYRCAMDDYVIYAGDASGAPTSVSIIAIPKTEKGSVINGAMFGEGNGVYKYTGARD